MFGRKQDIPLERLKVANTFKLNGEKWTIIGIGEYDWKSDGSSIEYSLKNESQEKAFLEVEFYKGKYDVFFSEEIVLDNDFCKSAIAEEKLMLLGKKYKYDEACRGAYKDVTNGGSWENLLSHSFINKHDQAVTIEEWEDGSFESFLGTEVKATDIKNINK